MNEYQNENTISTKKKKTFRICITNELLTRLVKEKIKMRF